ncbi:MAG TPA: hypothetical protein VK990_07785, partial [Acidimicrobiia bacterium]|nr:hypothetical protein [Acidimicrobiia bacterium]
MRSRLAALAMLLSLVGCGGGATTGDDGLRLGDLSAVWANGIVTLRINDAGEFLVHPADAAEQALMGGFVARDDRRFIFVSRVEGECPGDAGAYRAEMNGDQLTLTMEEDS